MLDIDYNRWQDRIAAARGEKEVDFLLIGGKVVNVFNCTLEERSVAVYDGHIVGFGDYPAREIIDLKGKYLAPGFIEGHIHIESSKLIPALFAETVVMRGTTTVIADPHEITNVWGIEGIEFMIESSRNLPVTIFFMLPSCVPATTMETSGATLSAEDLRPLLQDPLVLGVGELMNFPGAVQGDRLILEKVALAAGNRPVDGHAPGLNGKDLYAYQVAGPATDHECFSLEEAEEKLARGMYIMIREGSTARNLETLLPLVNSHTERRSMFVSDDRRPGDLLNEGHLDYILRRAVNLGLNPVTAVRMVTLNTAEAFGLKGRGAIRCGWRADLTAFENLEDFRITDVWHLGRRVVTDGSFTGDPALSKSHPKSGPLAVPAMSEQAFHVPDKRRPIRVIRLIPNQITTGAEELVLPVEDGLLQCDLKNDIVKLVVIERYSGSGRLGVGFVKGFGIKQGAFASTVAHDSHNIIAAGVDDQSLSTVVNRIIALGGGQAVALGEKILAELPLPFGGLMSDRRVSVIAEVEENLISAARMLGYHQDDPFMVLSFLALPVIPELKLTDLGLVDVTKFQLVSLYA